MKKLTILLFLIIPMCINAQEINFGLGTSLAFRGPTFGIQARGGYFFTDRFNVSGAYTYYIRENTNYAIDLDARFILFNLEEYEFSPLGGININRIDGPTGISLNAGFFTRIYRDVVDIYLEPKLVIDTKTYFVLSGGLYF